MSFQRTDVATPAGAESVAIGDLDGTHGPDKVKADRTDTVKHCEFVKRAVRRARRH